MEDGGRSLVILQLRDITSRFSAPKKYRQSNQPHQFRGGLLPSCTTNTLASTCAVKEPNLHSEFQPLKCYRDFAGG
jgi:hypothetical protein